MSQYFIDVVKYVRTSIKNKTGVDISVATQDYRNIRFFTDEDISSPINIYRITGKDDLDNATRMIYKELFC